MNINGAEVAASDGVYGDMKLSLVLCFWSCMAARLFSVLVQRCHFFVMFGLIRR